MSQHRRLRAHIVRLDERVLRACHNSAKGAGAYLEPLAKGFANALRQHMLEEERLLPELLRYRTWGAERLRRLRAEHHRQNRHLEAFEAALGASFSLRHAADLVFALVRAVEVDIDFEERTLLNVEGLRDDAIPVDQGPF